MTTIKFDKRGMPDMWTERQSTLTDNCIKKIADEVVKRLNDKDEIVRCKDCKYWEYDVDNDVGFCVRTEDCDWNADDFCSRGERK